MRKTAFFFVDASLFSTSLGSATYWSAHAASFCFRYCLSIYSVSVYVLESSLVRYLLIPRRECLVLACSTRFVYSLITLKILVKVFHEGDFLKVGGNTAL